jgi:hypothetical protein
MTEYPPSPRKPGRPRSQPLLKKVTIMLPQYLHNWAAEHPEGLSGLARRLFLQEYEKAHKP